MAYTENKDKAEQFGKTYREFSKLKARKADRAMRKAFWKHMKQKPTGKHESEEDLTLEEMEREIGEQSGRSRWNPKRIHHETGTESQRHVALHIQQDLER